MIAVALIAIAEPLVVAPFASFDGKVWSGLTIGSTEREVKRQFPTAKTEIADPASVRVRTDRKDWIVSAVVTETGGKGSVVGIAVERERQALTSLADLRQELGEPDGEGFPDLRFSDWSVSYWKSKGIAAIVDRGTVVRSVLMADPAALSRKVSLLADRPGRLSEPALVEVGEIDVRPDLKLKDSTAEVFIGLEAQRAADRIVRDYRGRGWVGARGGRNTIEITLRIEKKGDKDYRLEANARLDGRTPYGNGSWYATVTDNARDSVSVGLRVQPLLDRVARDLGDRAHEAMGRLAWQAEWRPFYNLARP